MQAAIVRRTPDCEVASERITTEAYRLGSMDNISAVVVQLNCSGPWTAGQRAQIAVRNLSQRGVRAPRPAGDAEDAHGVTVRMQPAEGHTVDSGSVTVSVPSANGANGTQ